MPAMIEQGAGGVDEPRDRELVGEGVLGEADDLLDRAIEAILPWDNFRASVEEAAKLAQPEPGTMAWTTPSGRSYATGPTTYPG